MANKILCRVKGVIEEGEMCGDIKVGCDECSLDIGECAYQKLENNVHELLLEKQIHDLQLHENLEIDGAIILRVPGGWLYSMIEMMGDQKIVLPPVLVPYNKEFKRGE